MRKSKIKVVGKGSGKREFLRTNTQYEGREDDGVGLKL